MNTNNRLNNFRRKLIETGLDAFFVSSYYNRLYLSGFSGSAGYLFITPQEAVLATDFRYIEQSGREAPEYRVFRITGGMAEWLPSLLGESRIISLGFEAEQVSFALHQQISDVLEKSQPDIKLVPVAGMVESLRIVKEGEEIELISQAAAITGSAFRHISEWMKPGMTELEVAWEIEKFMREKGSEPLPFDNIVASGPNAALPHAKPSSRVISAGETVVIDIGSRFHYYTSDLTRTVCTGKPDGTYRKIYDIVLQAQMAVIEQLRDGMTGGEADNIARSVIAQAGYGDNFGHGTGHGIGLETHETPRLSIKMPDKLTGGMVFTVEPGIYIPGWGGVRIEDDVVLENGKAQVISHVPK